MTYGMLHNYETGEPIRPATLEELEQSVRAARVDGGCGVFELDGVRHFVTGEEMFDWSVRANDANYELSLAELEHFHV